MNIIRYAKRFIYTKKHTTADELRHVLQSVGKTISSHKAKFVIFLLQVQVRNISSNRSYPGYHENITKSDSIDTQNVIMLLQNTNG